MSNINNICQTWLLKLWSSSKLHNCVFENLTLCALPPPPGIPIVSHIFCIGVCIVDFVQRRRPKTGRFRRDSGCTAHFFLSWTRSSLPRSSRRTFRPARSWTSRLFPCFIDSLPRIAYIEQLCLLSSCGFCCNRDVFLGRNSWLLSTKKNYHHEIRMSTLQ